MKILVYISIIIESVHNMLFIISISYLFMINNNKPSTILTNHRGQSLKFNIW